MTSYSEHTELERYMRVFGSDVAQLARESRTPLDLLGIEPWWLPNPNPFPNMNRLFAPRWERLCDLRAKLGERWDGWKLWRRP